MDELKKMSVWELLRLLQDKVKNNITKIQKNLDRVQLLRANYTSSSKRDRIISDVYSRNTELTAENTNFLELHNTLYQFSINNREYIKNKVNVDLEKAKMKADSNVFKEYRSMCLKQTVSGELKLMEGHPFIKDQAFMNDLMEHCQKLELYERCSEIVRVRELEKVSKS